MIALFDNWDSYVTTLGKANNATGTLQEQQEIYMDSIQAKLNSLTAAVEKLYGQIINDDVFKGLIDGLTGFVSILTTAIDKLGGLGPMLLSIGGIASKVFGKHLASNISGVVSSLKGNKVDDPRLAIARQMDSGFIRGGAAQSTENFLLAEKYASSDYERQELSKALSSDMENRAAIMGEFAGINSVRNVLKEGSHDAKKVSANLAGDIKTLIEDVDKYITGVNKDVEEAMTKASKGEFGGFSDNQRNTNAQNLFDAKASIDTFKTSNLVSKSNFNENSIDRTYQLSSVLGTGTAGVDKLMSKYNIKSFAGLEAFINSSGGGDRADDVRREALEYLDDMAKKVAERLDYLAKSVDGVSTEISDLEKPSVVDEALSSMNTRSEAYKDIFDQAAKTEKLEKLIGIVGDLGVAAGGFTMAWSGVTAIFDESLTPMEKVSTAFTSLTSGVSILASSLPQALSGLKALPALLGLSGGAIVGIGAAITALIGGIAWGVHKINEVKNAAKQANSEMAASAQQASDTTTKYNNLSSSLEELNNKKSTLSDLTKGTTEWKMAVAELNQQILKLLKTYPELAKYITQDSDGILSISDEGQKELLDKQAKAVENANRAHSIDQINSNNANVALDSENVVKQIRQEMFGAGKLFTDSELSKILSAGPESLVNADSLIAAGVDKAFTDAVLENRDAILSLIQTIESNNTSNEMLSKSLVSSKMNDVAGYGNLSDASKEAVTQLASQTVKATEESSRYLIKNILSGDYINNNAVKKNYAEAMNTSVDELSEDITTDQMREYLAKEEELKASLERAEGYVEKVGALSNKVAEEIFEATKKLGDPEIADMLNSYFYGGKGIDAFSTATPEQIEMIKGLDMSKIISEEDLTSVGVEKGKELIDGLSSELEKYDVEKALAKREEVKTKTLKDTINGVASATGKTVTEVKAMMEEIKKFPSISDSLKNDEVALAKYAKEIFEIEKAFDGLSTKVEKNKEVLNAWASGGEFAPEAREIVLSVQKAFQELTGTELGLDVLRDNWDSFVAYIEGDRSTAIVDKIISLAKDQALVEIQVELDGVETAEDKLNALMNYANNLDPATLEAVLNDKQFIETLNHIIKQTGIGANEINNAFSQIGIEPTVKYKKLWIPDMTPTYANVKGSSLSDATRAGVAAMSIKSGNGGRWVQIPYIAGAKKKVNTIGSLPASSTKSSGGSKGSKGSGSSKSKDTQDRVEDSKDLYHDINIEIEKQNRELSKLQKAQEKAFGKDLLNNLNAQLSLLERQKRSYAEKLKIAKQDVAMQQKVLASYGATFNAQNQISNYSSLMTSELKKVNAAISRWNKLSAAKQTDAEKDKLEDAKERYSKIQELISNYDSLVNSTIPEIKESVEDILYSQIEIQIEKFNLDVKISLELSEAQRQWSEFKRRVLNDFDDDSLTGLSQKAFEDMQSYYSNEIGDLPKKLIDTMAEINKMNGGGLSKVFSAIDPTTGQRVNDKEGAMEYLKTNLDELTAALIDIENLKDSVKENFLSSIDAISDAYSKQAENYEFIKGTIQHTIQLNKMMVKEGIYNKEMLDAYDEQVTLGAERTNKLKEQADYWENLMNKAKAVGDDDSYEKYLENWESSIESLNSSVEEWATAVTERYEAVITDIFNNLNNQLTNGLGLDYVNDEFSLLTMNANNYLDAIDSAYGMQKLEAKWIDSINNTSGVESQKELNKLMTKQLSQLREKEKITKRDLDRAELEYQIALKQIALRESEQNKSKMRLVRDSQGNYSYQFTTDTDEISKKQQELLDAKNELYNFDKNAYAQNLNEVLSTWSDFQTKASEIYMKYKDDEEGREKALQLLREQYGQRINFLTEENGYIRTDLLSSQFSNFASLYEKDLQNWINATGEEKESLEKTLSERLGLSELHFKEIAKLYGDEQTSFSNLIDAELLKIAGSENGLIPTWNSGVQSMIDKMNNKESGFEVIVSGVFSTLSEKAREYQDEIEEISVISKSVKDDVVEHQKSIKDASDKMIAAAITEYETLKLINSQMETLITNYLSAAEAAKSAADAAWKQWEAEKKIAKEKVQQQTQTEQEPKEPKPTEQQPKKPKPTEQQPKKPSKGGGGNGVPEVGETVTYIGGTYYSDSYGSTASGSRGKGKKVKISKIIANPKSGQNYPIHVISSDSAYGWVKKSQLSGFDTGGYTGSWGGSGKLALLHEKELVLNKEDTKNLLFTVELMRDVINEIQRMNAANTASALTQNIIKAISPTMSNANSHSVEQTVHIEANFPNANSVSTIEEAFKNLSNIASQRVNRNNR